MERPVTSSAGVPGRHGRFAGPLLAGLVVALGIAATMFGHAGLLAGRRADAGRTMDQRTEVARAAVQSETERYRVLIEAVAAGIGTDDSFDWDDFDQTTAPIAAAGLIGAVAVGYVVPAATAQIASTQRRWRARGADGLVLRPSGTTGEHFFSIFTRSLTTTGEPLAGVDLSAATAPADALTDARRLAQPAVSDAYVLLGDRKLPRARQPASFAFVAPIWTRAPIPRFRGWIVLDLRGQDLLSGVLSTAAQGQLDGELVAGNRDGTSATVAEYTVPGPPGPPRPGSPGLRRRNEFAVADQQWTLITRADPDRLPGANRTLAPILLTGGLAITALLAGLVHLLARGRYRAGDRVAAATAAWETGERARWMGLATAGTLRRREGPP